MEIRFIEPKDYPQWVALENAAWNKFNHPHPESVLTDIDHVVETIGDRQILVAMDGDVLLGYLDFHVAHDNPSELQMGIALIPEAQGRGLGSKLLAALEDWGRAHGYDHIFLRVFSTNPHAISLYLKNGFVEVDRLKDFVVVDGEGIDDVWMEKKL
jgi:ribosomal protein S18 acetylase RimI-like enzyme